MDREKHEKASSIWEKMSDIKGDIEILEDIQECSSLFSVGTGNNRIIINEELKTTVSEIVRASLHEKLAELEKEYEEL